MDQKTGYFLKEDFLGKLEIPFSVKKPSNKQNQQQLKEGPIHELLESIFAIDDQPQGLDVKSLTFLLRNKKLNSKELSSAYQTIDPDTGDSDLKESCSLDVLVATASVEAFKKRLRQMNGWTAGRIALVSVGALTIVGGGIFGLYYFNQQPTTALPEKKEVTGKDSTDR